MALLTTALLDLRLLPISSWDLQYLSRRIKTSGSRLNALFTFITFSPPISSNHSTVFLADPTSSSSVSCNLCKPDLYSPSKSSRGGLHSWQIHPEISPDNRLCIVSVLHAGQNMYFSAIIDPKKLILIKFGVLKTDINARRKNLLAICARFGL